MIYFTKLYFQNFVNLKKYIYILYPYGAFKKEKKKNQTQMYNIFIVVRGRVNGIRTVLTFHKSFAKYFVLMKKKTLPNEHNLIFRFKTFDWTLVPLRQFRTVE